MQSEELASWRETVLPLVWNKKPLPPPDSPLPGGGLALLSADTDRTQSYVFQSARLPEIRGASMRLNKLNRHKLRKLLAKKGLPAKPIDDPDGPPGCLIYAGGGSLLALIPPALGEELCTAIESLYPQKTGIATITAVYQPVSLAEIRGQIPAAFSEAAVNRLAAALPPAQQKRFRAGLALTPIQNLMRRQALHLRWRKESKTDIPHVESSPYARTCQSCGRRPAANTLTGLEGEPTRYLCHVCYQNDRSGRQKKSFWNRYFEKWCRREKGENVTAHKADDLSVIGQPADGYIGYIYTDGDNIGKLLESASDLVAYSALSRRLTHATETAVYHALYTHLRQDNKTLPFEIITIGGDDVLLIVPGHKALPIARDICARFSRELSQNAAAATMSAGVVLAHDSNPIYFLHDLATQLLKNAKRGVRNKGAGCLDYMTLKSQSTIAARLKDVRNSAYLTVINKLDKERCFLTGRPYTLEEIDRLLDGAAQIKAANLSPGQLHRMRQEFQNGRFPAIFYYLYQRARLKRHGKTLQAIEEAWGMTKDQGGAPPWISLGKASNGYRDFSTPFLDMLTLLDFIGDSHKEGADGN